MLQNNRVWSVSIFVPKVVQLRLLQSPRRQPIWIRVFLIMDCQTWRCDLSVWSLKATDYTPFSIHKWVIWYILWVMVIKPGLVRSTWSLTYAQTISVWWVHRVPISVPVLQGQDVWAIPCDTHYLMTTSVHSLSHAPPLPHHLTMSSHHPQVPDEPSPVRRLTDPLPPISLKTGSQWRWGTITHRQSPI